MKRALKNKFIRSNKGIVLAELALVIPFLILFIFGIFEISRMYYIQNTLDYGAKEAARVGASIRESVDNNFMGIGTISRTEIENLILNSVRVRGIIEEPGQFMISYLNMAGNEVIGVQNLPFNRQNNPGSIEYVVVEITYPGSGPNVNRPIPAVLNPGNILQNSLVLMSKAIFQIEGRF